MKNFQMWAPPVAVSVMLHAAIIVLAAYQLSASKTASKQIQAITVELLGNPPATESSPLKKPRPSVVEKPPVEPVKPAIPAPTDEARTTTPLPEQTTQPAADTQSSGLNIQPLSKLTRPPAFLRKIEPVYPNAEQRAGSQAYVLAEVTIDHQGNVQAVKILKSAGVHFDNAVLDALKLSMFVPGYIDKEAVAVRVLVPFRFNLK